MEDEVTRFMTEKVEKREHVKELMVQVVAAELHLTYFANRYGKHSDEYMKSLRDFGTAWYLLKKNRDSKEFFKEVKAAS